jgi:Papain-like cysteine protease AvrRpt2
MQRTFIVLGLVFCFGMASCSPPTDVGGAENQVIGKGLVLPTQGDLLVGPGLLSATEIIQATKSCEGSVGSIIPPLSVNQCAMNVLATPLLALENLQNALTGTVDPNAHHIYLNGIERYFVRQSEPENCWAATLETARDFLGLHPVSQDELIASARQICPRLREQNRGAEAYEIVYVIISVLKQYDRWRTEPHTCPDAECIITALSQGHPVIMLGSGHAVLLIGMDYTVKPTNNPKPLVVVERLFVFDPWSGQVDTWTPFSFCKIDVVFAY